MSHKGTFKITVLIAALFAVVFPIFTVSGNSGGASPGNTGGPGEGSCIQCHSNGPDDGDLFIQGVPANYELQQTYTLTVSLEDSGQSRWGFQLTAMDGSNTGAGTIVNTETTTSTTTAFGKDYVSQTGSGTYNGTPDGPVTWSFDWTAPATNVGPVTFYAAGNAANGNFGTSGDNIYTTNETADAPASVTPTATPDMQPTATPTGTGPTPTQGPCMETGTTLDLPGTVDGAGVPFYLNATFCNATNGELSQHALFVLMDAYGLFFFAPSWSDGLDYYTLDFPIGNTTVVVLPEFMWPTGAGAGTVTFYGAVLDPSLVNLIGNLDVKVFSWTE